MLGSDLATAIGARLPVVNDCRAFTLSEARLGAGQGAETVLGLIMGTGLAGGVVINGKLLEGPNGQAGEFGHLPLPYETVTRLGLPWLSCGCGRRGCYETLCSGPGLSRLAEALTGHPIAPPQLSSRTDAAARLVFGVWATLMGQLLISLILTLDPDVIVLGGGLSRIPSVVKQLEDATRSELLASTRLPRLVLAQGGDRSGARGAALLAWQRGNSGG